ncbi:Murein DD-endopeptidase MepM and murein hydrolase activator NlpD, contain LysM domain [Evansella caseinilytica]|uniref:Murein DD-endopeptidase MepM and murein hydrolase activator NlpD, contain LysM domain n=1 Tax=Evansella caseinilytica TaxID=1503961 RepID=A0A1H3MNV2_9BACI|nr:M23 family metallopeptidase [Evansella caseinilytica]SDY78153.1 Murein DD-endopeptidase MepM and murein hydrolase activator NlpD, contain LysM domain [Evansella caseinilytica]
MKKIVFYFIAAVFVAGCNLSPSEEENGGREGENADITDEMTTESQEPAEQEEIRNTINVEITELQNHRVVEVKALLDLIDGSFEYDDVHKALVIHLYETEFKLVFEVPVLEKNGKYLAADDILLLLDEEGTPYVTEAFIEKGLGVKLAEAAGEYSVSFYWEEEAIHTFSQPNNERFDTNSMTVAEMIELLSFLEKPIQEAAVSVIPGHLPGAPRNYRNGYHEGIDWYDYASGAEITTDTPIYAMAEGIVVRADHDFTEYSSPEERNVDLAIAAEAGFTPDYILDRLRGQQVWVQYPNGVMNRFAHLDSIPEDLAVGDRVDSSTVIGYVGNSGTSHSVNQDGGGLHLHQDLLIYGELFWKSYSPEEVQTILTGIWK